MATQPLRHEIKKLPLVGRVEGAILESRGDQMAVLLQYTSRSSELCELEMPLSEAMRLLYGLLQIEKDSQNPPK